MISLRIRIDMCEIGREVWEAVTWSRPLLGCVWISATYTRYGTRNGAETNGEIWVLL